MKKTKIDWCDSTWNPVTGCYHTCEYCYARGIANRFGAHISSPGEIVVLDQPVRPDLLYGKAEPYPYNFTPTFHRYRLDEVENWKKGRNIFVCSMADLFGKWIPDEWIMEVFEACNKAPQHNYLFLTKNPERYYELEKKKLLPLADNMWYGTTVTDKHSLCAAYKAFGKLDVSSHTFLSIEPLLGDVLESCDARSASGSLEPLVHWNHSVLCCKTFDNWKGFFDWVIIGAESGSRKEKIIPEREWIKKITEKCIKADIPVFMKSSLTDIWGEELITDFPKQLKREESKEIF